MIRFFLVYLSIFLYLLPECVLRIFGKNVTFEQVLFHTNLGMDAVKGADSSLSMPFYKIAIIPIFFILLYFFISKSLILLGKNSKFQAYSSPFLWFDKIVKAKRFLFCLLLSSTVLFCIKTDVISYAKSNFSQDYFSPLYFNPENIMFKNQQNKKNLLLIYVESLENNLNNQAIHKSNLIEPIDNLAGIKIPKFYPAPGTGWSIAGMVSSQCSVPIKLNYGRFPTNDGKFLPNVICLGDVLNEYGYKQYFLAGHDLALSSTGKFYKNHGYTNNFGMNEWMERGVSESNFTGFGHGIHDDVLLNEAEKIMKKNQASQQPFNLTLITVDTHATDGFPSNNCTVEEQNSGYEGAFKCSAKFIANFIKKLESKNLLENTIVVILGDHPFMESPEKSASFPDPRYVYIKYRYPQNKLPLRDKMTHFDVAPSILDLMGLLEPSNTKFGLGYSVFSEKNGLDYNQYFNQVTNKNILNQSETYASFWNEKSSRVVVQ